jgi:murein L,D-transpeptidase YafK
MLGPKLRQGDRQVPEGVYGVEALNPNSSFHLSLRLDYPNADDLRRAREADIADPGSDIMIHGNTCSIGCLAMGDEAAEDLFVLAAETGLANIKVILSPVDFRVRDLPENLPALPAWVADRYSSLRRELALLVP